METLEAYLARKGIRQADFANAVGATQATISKLIGGSVTPSLSLAVRIQNATDGSVRCESWVSRPETPSEDAA